ncbi:SAM-dependent methyltransferase [Streptomyces chrestomyceticus]|uniref:SAM-dependent methyltransferase n=1 Tax=Streptomyces chrestomyceticus TaxID=68185 RepID=UPI0034024604
MTQPAPVRRDPARPFRPRLLDAFCCQGGAGMGYHLAGFEVTGVDKDAQSRYPLSFHQGDAIAFIREFGAAFDFIHASPPCQYDSDCQRIRGRAHPDLIGPTREALEATGRPWVMENVRGAAAKLRNPVMLCGAMFGLETYRHRYFETGGGFTFTPPPHPPHTAPQAKMGRPVPPGHYGQYIGNFSGVPLARQVMGVPWMNRDGIRECIPPVYARHIGRTALAHLRTELEVAA